MTKKKNSNVVWGLVAIILIIYICWALSGCLFLAGKNNKWAIGSGSKTMDAEGNVLKIECNSPLKNIFGITK